MLKKFLLIASTLLIALLFALVPLPQWAIWIRPAWVALVLIYWTLMFPGQVSLGIAFLLGIILDILNNTLLGEHALALVLVSFCVLKLQRQVRFFPLLQQSLFVGLFILIYQFVLYLVQGITRDPITEWQFWLTPMVSIVYWPFLYIVLQTYRQRYRIR